MTNYDKNQSVTVDLLNTSIAELKQTIKESATEVKESVKHMFGEYTEEILVPAVRNIVQEENGESKTELKDYIDEKIGSLRGDLISVLRGEHERDHNFKIKILEIIRRNKLAPDEELVFLTELAK